MDGKTIRGARRADGTQVHLLAAMTGAGLVTAQREVDGKTKEITVFRPLLAGLDLADTVVTSDALHSQTAHARVLVEDKKAHYIAVIKGNKPLLHEHSTHLPWRDVPLLDKTRATAHGRDEIRRVKTCTVARGLAFHTQRSRCRSCVGVAPSQPEGSLERIYAVTDLTTDQAGAPEIAQRVRDHWGIENKIHHVRDTTWAKDASRIRTGNAPRTMASLRNLVVRALRLAGHTSVAASLRHHARNTNRPLATLGIMYSTGQIT